MTPHLSLSQAHAISEDFEESTMSLIPEVKKFSIHLESSESHHHATDVTQNQADLVARIQEYASSFSPNCSCIDVHVVEDESGYTLTLTCQIDGSITLTESHEIADNIEKGIRRDIIDAKVFVHMEPNT
jgi:divalent metal cation (Fe/Co/Zn/Cd) transporter